MLPLPPLSVVPIQKNDGAECKWQQPLSRPRSAITSLSFSTVPCPSTHLGHCTILVTSRLPVSCPAYVCVHVRARARACVRHVTWYISAVTGRVACSRACTSAAVVVGPICGSSRLDCGHQQVLAAHSQAYRQAHALAIEPPVVPHVGTHGAGAKKKVQGT